MKLSEAVKAFPTLLGKEEGETVVWNGGHVEESCFGKSVAARTTVRSVELSGMQPDFAFLCPVYAGQEDKVLHVCTSGYNETSDKSTIRRIVRFVQLKQ